MSASHSTHTLPHAVSLIKQYKYQGIPIAIVRRIAREVCRGLDFLHRHCSVIHTDLKPENVLLTRDLPTPPSPMYSADERSTDDSSSEGRGRSKSRSTSGTAAHGASSGRGGHTASTAAGADSKLHHSTSTPQLPTVASSVGSSSTLPSARTAVAPTPAVQKGPGAAPGSSADPATFSLLTPEELSMLDGVTGAERKKMRKKLKRMQHRRAQLAAEGGAPNPDEVVNSGGAGAAGVGTSAAAAVGEAGAEAAADDKGAGDVRFVVIGPAWRIESGLTADDASAAPTAQIYLHDGGDPSTRRILVFESRVDAAARAAELNNTADDRGTSGTGATSALAVVVGMGPTRLRLFEELHNTVLVPAAASSPAKADTPVVSAPATPHAAAKELFAWNVVGGGVALADEDVAVDTDDVLLPVAVPREDWSYPPSQHLCKVMFSATPTAVAAALGPPTAPPAEAGGSAAPALPAPTAGGAGGTGKGSKAQRRRLAKLKQEALAAQQRGSAGSAAAGASAAAAVAVGPHSEWYRGLSATPAATTGSTAQDPAKQLESPTAAGERAAAEAAAAGKSKQATKRARQKARKRAAAAVAAAAAAADKQADAGTERLDGGNAVAMGAGPPLPHSLFLVRGHGWADTDAEGDVSSVLRGLLGAAPPADLSDPGAREALWSLRMDGRRCEATMRLLEERIPGLRFLVCPAPRPVAAGALPAAARGLRELWAAGFAGPAPIAPAAPAATVSASSAPPLPTPAGAAAGANSIGVTPHGAATVRGIVDDGSLLRDCVPGAAAVVRPLRARVGLAGLGRDRALQAHIIAADVASDVAQESEGGGAETTASGAAAARTPSPLRGVGTSARAPGAISDAEADDDSEGGIAAAVVAGKAGGPLLQASPIAVRRASPPQSPSPLRDLDDNASGDDAEGSALVPSRDSPTGFAPDEAVSGARSAPSGSTESKGSERCSSRRSRGEARRARRRQEREKRAAQRATWNDALRTVGVKVVDLGNACWVRRCVA